VFAVCLLLYKARRELLYVVVVLYFLSSVPISAFTADDDPVLSDRSRLYDLATGKNAARTPSIYLLTYDSYVENETMLQYGIDNSAQETYLQERGFQLYKGVYSVDAPSIPSMGLLLGLGGDTYKAVSGDGDVQLALKQQGYETFGVFHNNFFFRNEGANYDHNIPPVTAASYRLLWLAILEGEFRFDTGFDRMSMSAFFEKKRAVLRSTSTSPRFLYTHTGPRHSQNSGACLDNETELFEERLGVANSEMKEDIAAILESDEEAIIIVNGDHGPYLTKNCWELEKGGYSSEEINKLDIQDRVGTFLAIRWPDNEYTRFDDISILQDVFPAVFAYMFDDVSLLDGKMGELKPEINGVTVEDGVIVGGADSGERLFDSMRESDTDK